MLDFGIKRFDLVFEFRWWQGHNRRESLVKRIHLTEQFEDSLAGASRCFGHLFPMIGLSWIGFTLARSFNEREEFMKFRHHFGVVSWIFLLQFQDLAHQPIKEARFFRRDAGGHRPPGRSGSEAV